MTLESGSRCGPYEIVAPLGAGGMGEVYRARDGRLGRDVAIKVLPAVFAQDPERMARFQREAQVLASLNHPNIAILHGLEEAGSVRALVMELVEGPTLAERIATGPLALEEALPLARQIAEALEAAHEKGIVHRDLKPANVKVKPDGTVKVLDFGLAKALDDDPGASSVANSPTMSLAATRAGVILGTAAYMSPEQAKGKPVDRRADIWAFGVVLLEMLTGRPAYTGETAAETLASVMLKDPGLDRLPPDTPAALRRLLERCLDKDPRTRLRDIGEARIVLQGSLAPSLPPPVSESPQRPVGPSPRFPVALSLVAAAATLAAVVLAFFYFRPPAPPPERVLRYTLAPPDKTSIHTFTVSPDGRYVALAALAEGKRQLWVRALDTLTPQALPGTEGAQYPFWSPDSRYLGFFAQGKLRKIAVSGGPAQTLCDAADGRGGTWNRDGVIVFAPSLGAALHRVPAVGGVPAAVTSKPEAGNQRFPLFLPDGRHFLYLVSLASDEKNGVHLAALDSKTGRRVMADVSSVLYVPPAAGSRQSHLLFVRENTLMAHPFDLKTLQLTGELFPVVEQVSFGANTNYAPVSVSDNGVMVYQTGRNIAENQLAWFERSGKPLGPVGAPGRIFTFALSPDEKRIAVPRWDVRGSTSDIWLHELARGTETRFTFHVSRNSAPTWSPDGSRLAFNSDRSGRVDLYQKDAGGAGQDELLLQSGNFKVLSQWSRDGRLLVYEERDPKTKSDLWVLPLEGDRKPRPFLQTEFSEVHGQLSPDGRWMAYTSDESGRPEVYVRPFPSGSGKWKVSTAGGHQPRWRRDGKNLYYLGLDRKLMEVPVKPVSGARPDFEVGAPEALFETRVPAAPPLTFSSFYDVTADGKRFLINTSGGENAEAPLFVVTGWQAGLKK